LSIISIIIIIIIISGGGRKKLHDIGKTKGFLRPE